MDDDNEKAQTQNQKTGDTMEAMNGREEGNGSGRGEVRLEQAYAESRIHSATPNDEEEKRMTCDSLSTYESTAHRQADVLTSNTKENKLSQAKAA